MRGLSEDEVTSIAALTSKFKKSDGASIGVFNDILVATKRTPYATDLEPWRAMQVLFWLRNALVHARPADTGLAPVIGTHHDNARETVEALQGYAFAWNPHISKDQGNGDWPDRVISAGCAGWAVASAETFAADFAKRLGVVWAVT